MKENENPFNNIIEEGIYNIKENDVDENTIETERNTFIYNNNIEQQLEKINSVQVGTIVIHKKFGKGKVISINKKRSRIKVSFENGDKQFILPNAFIQGHLSFE